MNNASILIAGISNLPPLPAVASRLLAQTADSGVSIDKIIETIGMDPALSAAVLKLSNSAFYGRIMKVRSLKQAVQVLGFVAVRNLVLLITVFKSFKNLKKNDRLNLSEFWMHSFLCGLAAEILAKHMDENRSDLFIMGLMHDIGKLLLYQEVHEDYLKVIEASGNSLYNTLKKEDEILGINHAVVGKMLFAKWMFPADLLCAAEFHHHPWKAPENKIFPMMINVADFLAHSLEITADGDELTDPARALFYPEMVSLFASKGITWNPAALIEFKEQLDIQKTEKGDFFNLMFS